jgi:hypothetical protein
VPPPSDSAAHPAGAPGGLPEDAPAGCEGGIAAGHDGCFCRAVVSCVATSPNAKTSASISPAEISPSPSAPLLITFAELDLLQMQVQAGELFARLVTEHGLKPQLRVIPGHNHLTQGYAVNTGDESLSAPLLEFMRACRPSVA